MRWTGKLLSPETGLFTFESDTDDCLTLMINGTELIKETTWKKNGTGKMNLTQGIFYDFVLEYCEYIYVAHIYLKWSAQDRALEIIPSEYFFNK